MKSVERIFATLVVLVVSTAAAWGQPRVHFSSPIVGRDMLVVVDRADPGATVVVQIQRNGLIEAPLEAPLIGAADADASGCARFPLTVPNRLAGETWLMTVRVGEHTEHVPVHFQYPQLLVTGVSGGTAFLSRVEFRGDRQPFHVASTRPLGTGTPGGAARDGRGTRTYVIADADEGVLLVVPDDEAERTRSVFLRPGLRDIVPTPDGRSVLVTSAGGGDSVLYVIDTEDDAALPIEIPIEPIGPNAGRIVVTENGFRAFVSVHGLLLHEVHLLTRRAGILVTVRGPGQDEQRDEIRDLRIVDGVLLALTGREDHPHYVTGIDVANLNEGRYRGVGRRGAAVGVFDTDVPIEVLVHDRRAGTFSSVDPRTLIPSRTLSVPPGAVAMLLPHGTNRSNAALLYEDVEIGSSVLSLDLDRFQSGLSRPLDRNVAALRIPGEAEGLDWYLVADRSAAGGLLAIEPTTLSSLHVDLGLSVVAASLGR